jgi:hypothetical protein
MTQQEYLQNLSDKHLIKCDTEEEQIELSIILDKNGFKWISGCSYIGCMYGVETYYLIKKGSFLHEHCLEIEPYVIVEFKEI